jgi:hypothetical protein
MLDGGKIGSALNEISELETKIIASLWCGVIELLD